MSDLKVGDNVRAHHKSGIYIGKVVEDRGEKFLVQVLSVTKHPMQGDLHHPGAVEDVFFHQRKALSYNEKANVSKKAVYPFEGEIPPYKESLKQAVEDMEERLQKKETEFNKKALNEINKLKESYPL
ncbi:kinase-associated lipoprotein B [Aquibacillus sp. 3ASR75-11]|uniref:Kinase-associated lipoprotein B n=1 Tax=Terrihalobacillus insolitus TaxID=2950438 RepID=A0A9X3WQC5_9BACI|nr:kinase-associated lipoprotein B [Terrihalobacillus insolitus]MDC3412384.1 kinase-associated lipoprotein B [Terrihalobacillus insolitus]MDC3422923.1 kinase-associated lipoprotein B [Terrihalobacillus insolitus]